MYRNISNFGEKFKRHKRNKQMIKILSCHNTLMIELSFYMVRPLSGFIKTKAIWIGSKKFSNDTFYHGKLKIEWEITDFKLVEITFSVDLK